MSGLSPIRPCALLLVGASVLAVLTGGQAAAGPYDSAYGIQCNRLLEGAGNGGDGSGTGTPDGLVNQDDMDSVRNHLGGGGGQYDFDGDGDEDLDDVTFWKEKILDYPPGEPPDIIPEPATLALPGLAACGLGGCVRRRRGHA